MLELGGQVIWALLKIRHYFFQEPFPESLCCDFSWETDSARPLLFAPGLFGQSESSLFSRSLTAFGLLLHHLPFRKYSFLRYLRRCEALPGKYSRAFYIKIQYMLDITLFPCFMPSFSTYIDFYLGKKGRLYHFFSERTETFFKQTIFGTEI